MNKKAFTQPLHTRAGFTLFEIIIAMLVVGILSALAAPKVIDLVNEARRGDELNTVGNVRSGIALTYLGNVTRGITPQYPQNLDNAILAKASPTNPVYDLVLQHGITKSWEKLEPLRYRGPTGQEYEYDPADGSFEAVAEGGGEPLPPLTFSVTFEGGTGGYDFPVSVFFTSDGYVLAGRVGGGEAFYLAKFNLQGELVWSKTYGGDGSEYLYEAQKTSDGGYIMVGYTDSFLDPFGDFYIVKVNESGTADWERVYDIGGDYDEAYAVYQTGDGGYLIGGNTYSPTTGLFEGYLTKLYPSGDIDWSTTYPNGYIEAIQPTFDGGYMISEAGWLVAKTDSSGGIIWERDYGSVISIDSTSDDGHIMVGYSNVVKTDKFGEIVWQTSPPELTGEWSYISSVQQTSDGGYVVTGNDTSLGEAYLLKLTSSGTTAWLKLYGAGEGTSVQETPDGGYIISATDGTGDFRLIKTDANGTVQ